MKITLKLKIQFPESTFLAYAAKISICNQNTKNSLRSEKPYKLGSEPVDQRPRPWWSDSTIAYQVARDHADLIQLSHR